MSVDPAQLDALYDTVLKPRVDALEGLRVTLKRQITRAALVVGVPFGVFLFRGLFASALSERAMAVLSAASFAGIFVGIGVAALRYGLPGYTAYANYLGRFKHEVVREVFNVVVPDGAYSPHEGIDEAVFDAPGIFSTAGTFRSDDRVRGRIGRTPFEAAEVRRHYTTGGKNSRTIVVFHGLFFHLDFNKSLRGVTIAQPRAGGLRYGDRDGLSAVTLESPAFGEAFDVYACDEVEARYVLTPAMMERVLSLQQRTEHPVVLGFKGNRAYLGVHYGRALFEPGIAATTSREAIAEMAEHFAVAEFVVRELDLNTRIWTKGVDDSILRQPEPEESDEPLDAAFEAATSGTLTQEGLFQAATRSIGGGFVEAGDPVPQPAGSGVAVEHGAGTSSLSFGLGVWFWFSLLTSVACAAIGVAAFRMAGPQLGLGAAAGLLPVVPAVEAMLADAALALLAAIGAVAGIVGFFFTFYWLLRVRRVEVDASAVRIFRGLRPFPRTYSRPEYGRVVITGAAVFLAKADGLALLNVSASPNLGQDEVRWVAYEFRRALDRSARG